ncbi:hypothetical protein ASG92_23130 [Arthrobacter sp. Soil736]|uniref:hypothetical protein n=1 Tax=Arthrobacter sp. Soil736 TaxID=1736395 RepID=UPI0006F56A77|nr:hypothetical protein [Arthrobacter sp. Soil736]KRE58552.1 hypothetical protein ASG92_23130 [Arthrobacter sp. Soil736]
MISEAAEATEGYPFLIQLVGYYLWMEADKADWTLGQNSVRTAVVAAQRRNALVVVESALSDISDKDREFLDAMAGQDGPSTAIQIGQAIKSKPNVVSKYRNRLIAAGLIESAGYGKVDFVVLAFVNTFEDNCQACSGDLSARLLRGPAVRPAPRQSRSHRADC